MVFYHSNENETRTKIIRRQLFFFSGSGVLWFPYLHSRTLARNGHLSVALNEIKNSESNAFLHHYPMLSLEVEICMLVVQHTLLVLCEIIFLLALRKVCLCANILLLHKEAQVALLHKGIERNLNVVFNRQFWAHLKAIASSFFCVPNL